MTQLDILFVHNNYPAQFRNLAQRMAGIPGVRVVGIGADTAPGLAGTEFEGYAINGKNLGHVHPFARRFELESRRAEQVMYAAGILKMRGYIPRLIYVHPGWGEALPLRVLFPDAIICCYAEFYYAPSGTDVGFDREFQQFGVDGEARVVMRNAATLLALADADFAIAPTAWQRSVFPREFRSKIHVVHDGLDCSKLAPKTPTGNLRFGHVTLGPDAEIVTFVARNLEPYRGFHIFMRSLPAILRARPNAHVCIAGGDKVSYGNAPTHHPHWRAAMLEELGDTLDRNRVHFLGSLPYDDYLALLTHSRAHVYLTYPFVLSWSMLEAMAMECLIIGSDTAPVQEVIRNGKNGLLVPFFDPHALAEVVIGALEKPQRYKRHRQEARKTVVSHYNFDTTSWPKHLQMIEDYGLPDRMLDILIANR
ncbi:MAG: glycosyl transferase family 1 [Rhizobiales bacterium PAR1]|nr:MAG: glycosyl transferase family 1 [Rhizobiales bacterium PAR1]